MKKHYKFEIDCANCAAKVEDAIKKIDGVNNATAESVKTPSAFSFAVSGQPRWFR